MVQNMGGIGGAFSSTNENNESINIRQNITNHLSANCNNNNSTLICNNNNTAHDFPKIPPKKGKNAKQPASCTLYNNYQSANNMCNMTQQSTAKDDTSTDTSFKQKFRDLGDMISDIFGALEGPLMIFAGVAALAVLYYFYSMFGGGGGSSSSSSGSSTGKSKEEQEAQMRNIVSGLKKKSSRI
jgi:hypothetical protein